MGHITDRVFVAPVDIGGTLLVDAWPYDCFISKVLDVGRNSCNCTVSEISETSTVTSMVACMVGNLQCDYLSQTKTWANHSKLPFRGIMVWESILPLKGNSERKVLWPCYVEPSFGVSWNCSLVFYGAAHLRYDFFIFWITSHFQKFQSTAIRKK